MELSQKDLEIKSNLGVDAIRKVNFILARQGGKDEETDIEERMDRLQWELEQLQHMFL